MKNYLWCFKCKTTSLWLMDVTGLYFEEEKYSCDCTAARDDYLAWDVLRKFCMLPEVPERGVRYEIDYRGVIA